MSKSAIKIAVVLLLSILLIAGLGSFLYYRSLMDEPQYSLALLIDAAERDDRDAVAQLIDTDAVVDDFVPQVTAKAIELYGRGLPPIVLNKIAVLATPIMPAVKNRAREEVPRAIRRRSESFADVPFFALVFGADRYLDITATGDTAIVKSKLSSRPLELKMRRNGERWQITGVKDEQLATDIARTVGEQIIAIATTGFTRDTANSLGVGNLADLLRQAEEALTR